MPDEHKTALVIIGAGASYDVVPRRVDDRSSLSTAVDERRRPVLAKDIFTDSEPVREALAAYSEVDQLSSTIRASTKGLEDHLLELSRSTVAFRQRGIKEMPLYLRHLFTSISGYTKDPINYKALVQRLFDNSGFDQVTIVSLNYDLLLDRVLALDDFGGAFDSMEAYDRPNTHPHLLYVKLHGSIDWAWRLPGFDPSGVREVVATKPMIDAHRDLIHRATDWPADLGDPGIVHPGELFDGDAPLYPALAIPTGEYEFICPKAHVKKLREFLPTCSNVLVIGCSARDQRFLELLSSHLRIVLNFVVVDQGEPATAKLTDHLLEQVPQLGISKQVQQLQTHDGGFSGFLRRDGLEGFIEAASSRSARSRPAG